MRVAIHATLKSTRALRELATLSPFRGCLERAGFFAGDARPFTSRGYPLPLGLKPLPYGAIIGVATVVACLSTHTAGAPFAEPEDEADSAFGDWSPGRYAWRLADTAMLPYPIPFCGRQSPLYPVPGDILELITAQLRTAEVQHA